MRRHEGGIKVKIRLPYGEGEVRMHIPDENLIAVAEVKDLPALPQPTDAIKKAFDNPLKSERISEMARKGHKVTIGTSDIMRPGNYRRLILPPLIEELHAAGVDDRDITILDAVGSHPPNTRDEWEKMYGEDMMSRYKVINHNARDAPMMVDLGRSELGDSVILNKFVVECDLFIGIGSIQPCPTCGYDGGSKLISIGAASIRTIFDTHRAKNYWHPTARSGVYIGNQFREHVDKVAKKAVEKARCRNFFLIDAVINSKNEMIGVYAGDMTEVYRKGCELADKQWKVSVPRPGDILVAAAGYPFDRTPYELHASICIADRYPTHIVKRNGVLIFAGPCDVVPTEGTGSYEFLRIMRNIFTPDDILERVRELEQETVEPSLENFILHTRAYGTALLKKELTDVMVAGPKTPGVIRDIHFTPVRNVKEALKRALDIMGKDAEILVVPRTRTSVVTVTPS